MAAPSPSDGSSTPLQTDAVPVAEAGTSTPRSTQPSAPGTTHPSAQRTTSRRRQRSVRVTVAASLVGLAALVVVLALPTQSPLLLSLSSVFALLCGGTSSRIVHTELLQSRREAAADRTSQARAYRLMFHERAAEHAEFTTAMADRLAARDRAVHELEGTVVLAEARAMEAETRVKREARRANDAEQRVAELQEQLEIRLAEQSDELATWEGRDVETVVDLLAWEEKAQVPTASEGSRKQA